MYSISLICIYIPILSYKFNFFNNLYNLSPFGIVRISSFLIPPIPSITTTYTIPPIHIAIIVDMLFPKNPTKHHNST